MDIGYLSVKHVLSCIQLNGRLQGKAGYFYMVSNWYADIVTALHTGAVLVWALSG